MSDETKFLAKPSGDCCLNCFPHDGTPKGEFKPIADISTYIGTPPEHLKDKNRILLYFPDVWGIDIFTNGQLLVDYFASQGYLTLALDYFRGDSVQRHRKNRHDRTTNPNFDYEAWKKKHMAFAKESVPKWIEEVVKKYGNENTKYVCVGYCFGAPFVMDELAGTIVVAGAFAHPAFLTEDHFEKCAKPLFLSCSEIDHTFPTEARHRAEDILRGQKCTYHVQLFSGVEHGFALRGDMSDRYQRWVKEESAAGIIRWFDHFLDI